jgi:hypothetical protein
VPIAAAGLIARMAALGRPELSLRDLGIPERGDPKATRQAIQAVIDLMAGPGLPPGLPTIRGDGVWRLDRPLYFEAPLHWTGGNLATPYPIQRDVAFLGIPRAPSGRTISPDHWFPISSVMDGSSGMRSGYRTKGDSHLVQWSGPLAWGLSGAADGFTILLAIDCHGQTPTGTISLAGISEGGIPWPVRVQLQGGWAICNYQTADGMTRHFDFPVASGLGWGCVHLGFVVNLKQGWCAGFLGKLQADIRLPQGVHPAGSVLAENPCLPWKMASEGGGGNTFGSDVRSGLTTDVAFCGLRVDHGAIVANDGVGKPMRFLDGRPTSDLSCYFTPGPNTVGLLPLSEDVSDAAPNRYLDVVGQGVQSSLFVASPEHALNSSARSGWWFEDVEFRSGSSTVPYGCGATIGMVQNDARFDRCNFFGGAMGLGSPNWGYSWTIKLWRCRFGGALAGLQACQSSMRIDDARWDDLGVLGAVRAKWSDIRGRDWWMSYGGRPRRIIHAIGSLVKVAELSIDVEDGPYPTDCAFLAESDAGQGGDFGCWLELGRPAIGNLRGVPMFRLKGKPNAPAGVVRVTDPHCQGGTPTALFDHDNTFTGSIDNQVRPRCPIFAAPPAPAIESVGIDYRGLPYVPPPAPGAPTTPGTIRP